MSLYLYIAKDSFRKDRLDSPLQANLKAFFFLIAEHID